MRGAKRIRCEGRNQSVLLQRLVKGGVTLYDVVQKSPKVCFFTVPDEELTNFFAITNETCYNVKIIGNFGMSKILGSLKKSALIFVAIVTFTLTAYLSSNVLTGVDFYGSGAEYSERLKTYLDKEGFKRFKFFPKNSLKSTSVKALKDNGYLSFISLKKRGSRLLVTAVKKTAASPVKTPIDGDLVSTVTGTVSSITVYRGFTDLKVGDEVKQGDVLVRAEGSVKDESVKSGVVAFITVRVFIEASVNVFIDDEAAAVAFFNGEALLKGEVYEDINAIRKGESDKGFEFIVSAVKTVAVSTYGLTEN